MSGFALVFDQKEPLFPSSPVFEGLVTSVAQFKNLTPPQAYATGVHCVAAKLDSPSTLHSGVILDEATGSWLLAVGTVMDNAGIDPEGDLTQLLADYLEHGLDVLARLDGNFALVIYDQREESLILVADPFGSVSIFYGQRGDQFIASTSALAVAKAVQSRPSELGLRYFLVLGSVLQEMTLWQDVKRMLPATALKISRDGVKEFTYWSLRLDPAVANLSLNETVDCIIDVLSAAIRRSLTREGKMWLSLTGGFDSRTLASLVQHSNLPFKSYCHGPQGSRDVRISSLISQTMGWDHAYFDLPHDWGRQRSNWLAQTLGKSDAHLGILKTSRIIREQALKAEGHRVSLWGFGGEIYRGFYWKQEFFQVGVSSQVNYDRLLNYRLFPSIDCPVLRDTRDWVRTVRQELQAQLHLIGEAQADWPNTAKLDLIGTHLEGAAHAGAHISAVLGLQRAIAPFYFKDAITAVISSNHKWRQRNRLFRLLLERIDPKLAKIETADGGPAVPMRLTNLYRFAPYWVSEGKKLIWAMGHRFLRIRLWDKDRGDGSSYPMAEWLRETLSQLEMDELLAPAHMRSASLYDIAKLEAFLAEAQTDAFKHEGLLSRVITIEMALRSVDTSL